jgi:GNAT superfamily N-acetyltransferase
MPFRLNFEEFPDGPALTFARVPWDSELLGFEVVELRLREDDPAAAGQALAKWLRLRAPAPPLFLYLRMDLANVTLGEELAHLGFYPVELTYELSLPLHRLASVAPGWKPRARLRTAEPSDLPSLLSIAGSAFGLDRYHLDPHIPASRADARFSSWIAEGMKAGDPIFVYEEAKHSEILGFCHWRPIGEKTVDLSLAAVHPRFQGTGVGASMYEAVLRESRALGHDTATTRISAANLDVVNLFARLGFAFRRARMTWHHYRQP